MMEELTFAGLAAWLSAKGRGGIWLRIGRQGRAYVAALRDNNERHAHAEDADLERAVIAAMREWESAHEGPL